MKILIVIPAYNEEKGQKKRKRKSMRGGRSIQRDARPIVIGTPDLIRKRSANGGTPYRRGI